MKPLSHSLRSIVPLATATVFAISMPNAGAQTLIDAEFNIVNFGAFSVDTGTAYGSLLTATNITVGDPIAVSSILRNNIGLVMFGSPGASLIAFNTNPLPFGVGQNFTQVVTTSMGTFTTDFTVTADTLLPPSGRGTAATGIMTSSNPLYAPTPVVWSASYTQNAGSGQINGSFNYSTVVPEPSSITLLGLCALGLLRRRR